MVRFDAEIFRQAVDVPTRTPGAGNGSCTWIALAAIENEVPVPYEYLKLYGKYFKPENIECRYWWPFLDRESRYIALLLMAEMIENDDIDIGGVE
jgi:hypothetical protein